MDHPHTLPERIRRVLMRWSGFAARDRILSGIRTRFRRFAPWAQFIDGNPGLGTWTPTLTYDMTALGDPDKMLQSSLHTSLVY